MPVLLLSNKACFQINWNVHIFTGKHSYNLFPPSASTHPSHDSSINSAFRLYNKLQEFIKEIKEVSLLRRNWKNAFWIIPLTLQKNTLRIWFNSNCSATPSNLTHHSAWEFKFINLLGKSISPIADLPYTNYWVLTERRDSSFYVHL